MSTIANCTCSFLYVNLPADDTSPCCVQHKIAIIDNSSRCLSIICRGGADKLLYAASYNVYSYVSTIQPTLSISPSSPRFLAFSKLRKSSATELDAVYQIVNNNSHTCGYTPHLHRQYWRSPRHKTCMHACMYATHVKIIANYRLCSANPGQ